mgnify:CR=1 FL=1
MKASLQIEQPSHLGWEEKRKKKNKKYDIDGKNVRIIDHGSSELNSSISKVNDASYV